MSELIPRIAGVGYAFPKTIRKNSDPIFDWLRLNPPASNPFAGYVERRILAEGEDLMTIMVPAAQMALKNAGKKVSDIDMLLGCGSIGRFKNPNELSLLHQLLKLKPSTWAIPITNDFSNFNAALLLADALIRAGRAKTILICNGSSWTRNVDYHTPQSVSAGDGAGAVVVTASSDPTLFYVKDQNTIMATQYFGGMFTSSNPVLSTNYPANNPQLATFAPYPKGDSLYSTLGYDTLYSHNYFTINALGMQGFLKFAAPVAANSTIELLKKNKIKASDITYFPHQSTQTLIDLWIQEIQPGQEIDTIKKFANLGVATEAFNLSYAIDKKLIKKNNVVLMAMGDDIHVNSILLTREKAKVSARK